MKQLVEQHLASQYGHKPIVKILLEAGADPNVMDSNGMTPRDVAHYNHHQDIVEVFRTHKFQSNMPFSPASVISSDSGYTLSVQSIQSVYSGIDSEAPSSVLSVGSEVPSPVLPTGSVGPLSVQSIQSVDSGIDSKAPSSVLSIGSEVPSPVLPTGSVGPLLVQSIQSVDSGIDSKAPSSVLSIGSEVPSSVLPTSSVAPSSVKSNDLDD